MARLARDPEVEALIDAYRSELVAAGHFAENEVTSPARAFLLRVGGAAGWSRLSVEEQWQVSEARESAVVMWMIAAGDVRPRPEFLVRGYQPIGKVSAWVHREFHERFMETAASIGFTVKVAELQWWAVAKVAAVAGVPPDELTRAKFDAASRELIDAVQRFGTRSGRITLSTRLYGAEATLYHAGVIDGAPRKRAPNQSAVRQREWVSVPVRLAETLQGYVEQMRVTLRPGSMPHIERVLRKFALWLRDEAPEVTAVRDLRRVHIERYKRHVAQKPNLRGGRLSKRTVAGELSTLRICFERLAEWDGEDAPARTLMFPGDVPKLDDPLPRFIDDGAGVSEEPCKRGRKDKPCLRELTAGSIKKMLSARSEATLDPPSGERCLRGCRAVPDSMRSRWRSATSCWTRCFRARGRLRRSRARTGCWGSSRAGC